MGIYVAGALFTKAERASLDGLVPRLRSEGFDCLVPHEQFFELRKLPPEAFHVAAEGVRDANVMLAGLDGPSIDDGNGVRDRHVRRTRSGRRIAVPRRGRPRDGSASPPRVRQRSP